MGSILSGDIRDCICPGYRLLDLPVLELNITVDIYILSLGNKSLWAHVWLCVCVRTRARVSFKEKRRGRSIWRSKTVLCGR